MKALVIAASLTLAAPALAVPNATSAAQDATSAKPTIAAPYVMKAGAGDLYEIQSSQLALEKSRTEAVRSFAQMMIEHHRMTTKQVTDAAKTAGLAPAAPALEPDQATMIAQLQGLSGSAFDRAYIDQQKIAHQKALALHQTYARSGDAPALKAAAAGAVPIVERHIAALRALPAQ